MIALNIKSKQDSIKKLLDEDELWSLYNKRDSYFGQEGSYYMLKVALFDEDAKVGKIIEDKINSLISLQKEKYENCDIIYSYEVEEVSDEKNSYC